MIEYNVKTWRCETCDYAYSGAVPPTSEQNAMVFPGRGFQDDECPVCRTITMVRVTDPLKKTIHRCMEQSDIDALKAELSALPPEMVRVEGTDVSRVENASEQSERIAKHISQFTPVGKKELAEHRKFFECDA